MREKGVNVLCVEKGDVNVLCVEKGDVSVLCVEKGDVHENVLSVGKGGM